MNVCARCGREPVPGPAAIDSRPYCHGDDTPRPTCWQAEQEDGLARSLTALFGSTAVTVSIPTPALGALDEWAALRLLDRESAICYAVERLLHPWGG